ncbi:DNA repair exonuclease [Aquibacillus koreensis]|uniref:DNA repair exonuclease n=1 Tax=Aquibacillus koreensis TaxID=279446 RepID=A0A9X4AHP1_9BACI|nr:DNA repair exonuclease [Aquibacillus koreensis]MCT2535554.1 DNA repair exonuclease [Aquibacillus koreensis]MDC3420161.1 DNA repair exonuclease [Aquibacillus koreensis]
MSNKVSFIHCADLHIDSPFKGLSNVDEKQWNDMRESTFQVLDKIVDLAIRKEVDFILMVGDLFDQDQQSIKAQSRLTKAFEKLNHYNIAVYISYGNHDHISGRLFNYEYPKNVHVFPSEKISTFTYYKHGAPLVDIAGFSYEQRAVIDNKANEFKATGDTPYHIAMLHGSVHTNSEHDVYAPFQLSDLTHSGYDYWALGHIHKREVLKETPMVVYPGNTQGRSIKESGEKGCYYVELTKQQAELEFCPLQAIRFEEMDLKLDDCEHPQEIESILEKQMEELRKQYGKCVVRLHVTSNTDQMEQWLRSGYIDELKDFINEEFAKYSPWVIIQDIKVKQVMKIDKKALRENQPFFDELLQCFEADETLYEDLDSLFHHRQARKYIEPFSEEEKAEIKQLAEDLLIYQLIKD